VTITAVDELTRRRGIAASMASRYAANDGVAAVLLAGSVAPPDLEARIRRVLAAPMAGVPEFVRLTEETFDLVAKHLPAYDVAAARAGFGSSIRG